MFTLLTPPRSIAVLFVVGVLCLLSGDFGRAMDYSGVNARVVPQRYRVRMEATVKPGKSTAVVYLPLPGNTSLQTIERIDHSQGETFDVPGSLDEKLLKVVVGPDAPKGGEPVYIEFEAALWSLKVDFDTISAIHPYDKNSELYHQYTREELPYFDLNHERVVKAVDELATTARDNLDFARQAYFHVLNTIAFKGRAYLAPIPLAEVLKDNRGSSFHAGNYFISLLRRRGIPARNVFALNVSGDERRWQEFYLEKYGWIPVSIDLTARHVEPSSFFGMAVTPPFWRDRQPHCVALGYTVLGELPGVDEEHPIVKYTTAPKILVSGGRLEKPRLLVEKIGE